mmetsp:Transcript_44122/g.82033  ORF Transcript_44122/g.82033 Transcript_44122/m.82033 type:complete len:206 (-) Transcript_44122:1311-1928(-)
MRCQEHNLLWKCFQGSRTRHDALQEYRQLHGSSWRNRHVPHGPYLQRVWRRRWWILHPRLQRNSRSEDVWPANGRCKSQQSNIAFSASTHDVLHRRGEIFSGGLCDSIWCKTGPDVPECGCEEDTCGEAVCSRREGIRRKKDERTLWNKAGGHAEQVAWTVPQVLGVGRAGSLHAMRHYCHQRSLLSCTWKQRQIRDVLLYGLLG